MIATTATMDPKTSKAFPTKVRPDPIYVAATAIGNAITAVAIFANAFCGVSDPERSPIPCGGRQRRGSRLKFPTR